MKSNSLRVCKKQRTEEKNGTDVQVDHVEEETY